MQGKIIKGIAGFYYVYAEDGNTYECRAKGIFRKDKFKPLVGDNVDITVLDEKELEGSVTEIHKRKNSLIRPAVANVDQALVIFAMDNPTRSKKCFRAGQLWLPAHPAWENLLLQIPFRKKWRWKPVRSAVS